MFFSPAGSLSPILGSVDFISLQVTSFEKTSLVIGYLGLVEPFLAH